MPAIKPDDLSSNPRIHVVEGESQTPKTELLSGGGGCHGSVANTII